MTINNVTNESLPTLDIVGTNIVVHYVRGGAVEKQIESRYRLSVAAARPLISIVSVGEICSLALQWAWGSIRLRSVHAVLAGFVAIPLEFPGLIDSYAEIQNYCRRHGLALGENDLWIAATATATRARLLTTDKGFDPLDPGFITRDNISP